MIALGRRWLLVVTGLMVGCSEESAAVSVPVDFKLLNNGAEELFIQLNGQDSVPAYVELAMQGRTLRAFAGCATCLCDDCLRGGCAICVSLARVQRIGPGESFAFDWNGSEYARVEDGCRQSGAGSLPCLERRGVPPGPLTVVVTYSRSVTTGGPSAPGMYIGPGLTTSVVFQYPGQRRVEIPLP